MREFAFEFRDKSFDSKSADLHLQNPTPNNDITEENNAYEDPMEIPMEDVQYSKENAMHHYHYQESNQNECNFKYCSVLVQLFKKIVYQKVTQGMTLINKNFVCNLSTEIKWLKKSVFNYEANISLQKYDKNSAVWNFLFKSLENLGINVTLLSIQCKSNWNSEPLKWLFESNKSAVIEFINEFKWSDFLPSFKQLDLVILFHQINQFNYAIWESSIIKFIQSIRRPMIEKQYFSLWLKKIYGVDLK